jgi:hypothetical protein
MTGFFENDATTDCNLGLVGGDGDDMLIRLSIEASVLATLFGDKSLVRRMDGDPTACTGRYAAWLDG